MRLWILLASGNEKKAREMEPLLERYGIGLKRLADFPGVRDVPETGRTFAENAAQKAAAVAQATGHWTLADDSGLMVDALQGAPGVFSARYAGEPKNDQANNEKLLRELAGVPRSRRTARFVCHLAVADPQGEIRLRSEESCRGVILEDYRGNEGFGYDPLFLIPEYGQTFGQLSLAVKSCLSHRARALRAIGEPLRRLLS